MAFPTTAILKTGLLTEDPITGWTNPWDPVFVALHLKSAGAGIHSTGGGYGSMYYPSAIADGEVYVTIPAASSDNYIAYRQQTGTAGTTRDGYFFNCFGGASTSIGLYRVDAGVNTLLNGFTAPGGTGGAQVGVKFVGDQHEVYYNGTIVGSAVTDATYATGYLAMQTDRTSGGFLDFGGGSLAAVAYTVVNGKLTALSNVNAGGDDIDALTYKNGINLTSTELAALASQAGVAVTGNLAGLADSEQMRKILKRIVRTASS